MLALSAFILLKEEYMDLKRTELKFIITIDEYHKLKNEVKHLMSLDTHAKVVDRMYHVRSLYFDDLYDSHVLEKADGIEFHQKYRIRSYDNTACRLEYKTKVGTLTSKQSMWLTEDLEEAIKHQNFSVLYLHLDEPLLDQMISRMKLDHLKPSLWIDYDREAYTHPIGETRITFDKSLTVSDYGRNHEFKRKILEPRTMILEVKYTSFLPDFISKVIFHRNFQPMSYSKYYMGWLLTQV